MYKLDPLRYGSANLFIFLIILTNVIPPIAIDEYTPSLPYMVQSFQTTVAQMQLSVTYYLLAFAVSQIVCGLLSDFYGRRPVLLLNMPIFFIGSLFCIFATNIETLIIGRMFQGLGVGASALTGPALMADCFDGPELTKASSYYSVVYSFIPIAAPIFGGYIQEYLGWQYNFVFMLALSIIIYFIFYFTLKETHPRDPSHKLNLSKLMKNYVIVLTHSQYMVAVFGLILTWSLFMVFSIMAPFIIQVSLGYTPSQYGLFAVGVGLGFFVGNIINQLLIRKYSAVLLLQIGLWLMVALSFVLLSFPLLGYFNIYTIMIPIFLIMCASGITFPHFYARAVSALPQYAGVAGALIGSLILLGAVIITTLITNLRAHSPLDMALVYVGLNTLCLIIFYFSKSSREA